jgi:hypothetical protein
LASATRTGRDFRDPRIFLAVAVALLVEALGGDDRHE